LGGVRIWAPPDAGAGGGGAVPCGFWPLDEGHGEVHEDREGLNPGALRGGGADAWVLRDLRIGAGRYYVCGVLCANPGPSLYTEQPDYPGAQLPPGPGRFLVYLDVWERTVTWIQDPTLREVALGGPDTAVRSQTVAQVKIRPIAREDDGTVLPAAPPAGRLQARRQPVGSLGNFLYRVEIHDAGWLGMPERPGAPTCKWSRRNGAVTFPIAPVRPEATEIFLQPASGFELALRAGDWIEILDDAAVLKAEARPLVQIEQVHADVSRLCLDRPVPRGVGQLAALHPFLRLWNQESGEEDGGTLPIQPGAWIGLEDGVEVCFEAGGHFATGDFWCLPARTLTGEIEWPQSDGAPAALPPSGAGHCGCPLAVLDLGPNGVRVGDRRRLFPPLTRVGGGGDEIPPGLAVLSESPSPPRGWAATGHYLTAPSGHRGWTSCQLPFPEICWLAGAVVERQVYLFTESAVWHWDPARPERAPSRLGPLPETRREFAVAARRGRIHAVGGFDLETGEPTGAHDEYDPKTGTWCSRAPLPGPRGALALLEMGGRLHALGGRHRGGAGGPLSDLHDVYHPERDGWAGALPLPQPLANPGAAAWGGRIALAGGTAAGRLSAEVLLFAEGSGWQPAPGLPAAVTGPAAAALQGSLWVMGGRDERGWTAGAAALDPEASAWAPRPPLPAPPRLPVAAVIRHELHVLSPLATNGGPRLAVQTWHGPEVFYILRKEPPAPA
ncbi:MAG TPA: DUF6519 domain-containing protein, partial [Thermoanaerobaculia bacterium]|nr:DUF6519 domain-containing protein [Thermoanaerobaculia bacterium]